MRSRLDRICSNPIGYRYFDACLCQFEISFLREGRRQCHTPHASSDVFLSQKVGEKRRRICPARLHLESDPPYIAVSSLIGWCIHFLVSIVSGWLTNKQRRLLMHFKITAEENDSDNVSLTARLSISSNVVH